MRLLMGEIMDASRSSQVLSAIARIAVDKTSARKLSAAV